MFGMVAHQDQLEERQTAVFIWERANLVSLGTELAEEAFQEIRGPNPNLHFFRELIEGETTLEAPGEVAHGFGFHRVPLGFKRLQALTGCRISV